MNIHSQKILILDFGSQYTQLIARRVRELGVYCEIWDYQSTQQEIEAFAPQGVIFSGGPETATASNSPRAPEFLLQGSLPLLGICYGMQTMAEQLGGKVEASNKSESDYATLILRNPNAFFDGIEVIVTADCLAHQDAWISLCSLCVKVR